VEGLGKDLKVLSKYECGLVVGPLNKIKGDFGNKAFDLVGSLHQDNFQEKLG
jgi:hypothetical protein